MNEPTRDAHETKEFRQRMQRIETLVQEVERFGDPAAREHTRQIVQAILDLHCVAIDRMLEHVAATGEKGVALIDAMAKDDLVSNVLLLHALHPADVETRVRQALDQVRPYLHSHGGNVEFLGLNDGVLKLRMQGSCHGCPSSSITLRTAIDEAIYQHAPDVTSIEVDGVVEEPAVAAHNGHAAHGAVIDGFVPIEQLFHKKVTAAV